jgi:nucleotide-binding universal stress UspA family protein
MFDSFGFVAAVIAAWLAIGVALAVVMGRRGHDSVAWFVVGTLMGPFAVLLAVDAWRHGEESQADTVGAGAARGGGAVDVLVGYDASAESAAALEAVISVLGERIGRLGVATVVPYGDIPERERAATDRLRRLADESSVRVTRLEVLRGHPSEALRHCAVTEGYDMIAVGARGSGITKAVLGSAATELARDSEVPVLVVGGARNGTPLTPSRRDAASPALWT